MAVEQLVLNLASPAPPTLENFLAGGNAAAMGVLRGLLRGVDRVAYLWGTRGSGKTHLLAGLTAAASGAGWTTESIDRHWDGASLGDARLLCVDDVDQMTAAAHQTLFDRYNRAHADGSAIVATGSVPPADLIMREDLRSRIASGVVLQVHPLSDSDKRAAIEANARGRGFDLKSEIVDYLLAHHARDMRSLSSIVAALDEYSLRTKRAVTLPLVRDALKQPIR